MMMKLSEDDRKPQNSKTRGTRQSGAVQISGKGIAQKMSLDTTAENSSKVTVQT